MNKAVYLIELNVNRSGGNDERKSAENIVLKKMSSMEEMEIKQYLIKKGYASEYIGEAMEKIEE